MFASPSFGSLSASSPQTPEQRPKERGPMPTRLQCAVRALFSYLHTKPFNAFFFFYPTAFFFLFLPSSLLSFAIHPLLHTVITRSHTLTRTTKAPSPPLHARLSVHTARTPLSPLADTVFVSCKIAKPISHRTIDRQRRIIDFTSGCIVLSLSLVSLQLCPRLSLCLSLSLDFSGPRPSPSLLHYSTRQR